MPIDRALLLLPARRLAVAAGIVALAAIVPDESLAAQAVPGIGDSLLVRALRDSIAAGAPQRCLALRVVPGDAAPSAMPRATGDSLADPRMPRRTSSHPPCDRVSASASSPVRVLRMPDGTLRALPPTKVPFPPRP
jgi:hypothetical protein